MEAIFASDWGKMQKAAKRPPAPGPTKARKKELIQSLATGAEKEIYEGLIPMAYTQWVIAPYQTFLMHNGPEAPGNNYVCRHWHEARTADVKPFTGEPEEALDTAVYRPFDEPGSKTPPAKWGYHDPVHDPRAEERCRRDGSAQVDEVTETEDGIEIHHGGANPPQSLTEGLFKAPTGETEPAFPKNLG